MSLPLRKRTAGERSFCCAYQLFVCLAILLAFSPAYSQYSPEMFNLKKQSEQYDERGFQGGQAINVDGKLAVSNANGGVNYSYTLDKFTEKGYGFQVSLNYCNSVAMSSFKEYNPGTTPPVINPDDPSEGYTGLDYWDKFTRNHPMWVFGVNGFAVQTLSLSSDYMPPAGGASDWEDGQLPWLIEGYDFCNRMNRMENTGQNDVISLLRADGSVLELRNPYRWGTEGSSKQNYEFVTGYYYEDVMNANGWAIVEYDTTNLLPDMLAELRECVSGPLGQANPNYWKNQLYQYLPRRVRYYPGDGLEYVFVEYKLPFGWERYAENHSSSGGKISGPTVFYLREITDASGVVMALKYSRQQAPANGGRGRACIKTIGEHINFNYANQFIVVEAHGRTTSLQLEKSIPLELFETQGGNYEGKTSIGMIKKLRDPENRVTEFGYENYSRIFNSFKHPYDNSTKLSIVSRRLNSIKEPVAQYSIDYYESDKPVQISNTDNTTAPFALANWRLNNVAHFVNKYNIQHQPLTLESYCFDGLDLIDEKTCDCDKQVKGEQPRTIYTILDQRTQKEKSTTYTFKQISQPRYRSESEPSPLAMPLVYTALMGTEEEADGKLILTGNWYTIQPNSAYVLPTKMERYIQETSATLATRVARVKTDYVVQGDVGYAGPLAIRNMYALNIEKKNEVLYRPEQAHENEVLIKNITEYLNLPHNAIPQQVAQVSWNKIASLQHYFNLRNAGLVDYSWEEMPYEEHIYTTLGYRPFMSPPFTGLVKETYQTDGQDHYLGGTKTEYETTSIAPGQNRRGLPLRTKQLSDNRASETLVSEITYGSHVLGNTNGGWLFTDERLPVRIKDGNGAIKEQVYRYGITGLMQATRINDDGTIKQEPLQDRISSLGLEKPLISRSLVRNPRTAGVDILESLNEWTFYGLMSGQRDLNGYYSRFQYDKNGRLVMAQLPKDFLSAQTICPEPFDGKKEYVSPEVWTRKAVTTNYIYCPYAAPTAPPLPLPSTSTGNDNLVLAAGLEYFSAPCSTSTEIATGLVAPPVAGETAEEVSGKRGREEVLSNNNGTSTPTAFTSQDVEVAVCQFDVTGTNNLFAASQTLRSSNFQCFVSSMRGRCFTVEVKVIRNSNGTVMANRSYVFNCPQSGSALVSSNGKGDAVLSGSESDDYMFNVPFTATEMQTFKQSGAQGFVVEISVATPGAGIVLVAEGEDKRPRWQLDGTFSLPKEQQQFTLAYEYSRISDTDVIQRIKTEDRFTAVNYPSSSSMCRPMRYTESRHEFGADRVVEKTKLSIGDPLQPTRIDEVTKTYSGLGQTRTATDQDGYTTSTQYDSWGRPVKITNADNSYTTIAYTSGSSSALLWLTQNFYGYYDRVTTTALYANNAYQHISSQYYDALGRLRVEEIEETNGSYARTFYEYDNQNRLVSVTNPKGDETRYWYDSYGRIQYKYQPDMGYTSYAYDAMGQVRYTQSQLQSNNGQLAFMQYDDLGRVTLVGETRLSGEPGGGGHGMTQPQQGQGKKETVMSVPAPPARLTDILDAKILHDAGVSAAVTANQSIWLPAWNTIPSFWGMNQLAETSACTPQPTLPQMVVPFLYHPVQNYNDPGLPLATQVDFENIARYPENARTIIQYDDLPVAMGSVWFYFPNRTQWDALAPNGVVRNLKGKEAAVAYRGHAGEPYHFVVMSYDERGRVEALLRYTENLGFDAVYYTYNAMNAIVSIRTVDPQRQSTTWYGYDWNGRVDSVWTKLSAAGNGLGIISPAYRVSEVRPTQPDIVYSYSKRGAVEKMKYPQVATEVNYRYNARAWLDTLLAEKNGALAFRQLLEYNELGLITKQRSQQAGQSEVVWDYTYDYLGQLTNATEVRNSVSTANRYDYDKIGNRVFNLVLGGQLKRNGYEYSDPNGPNRLSMRRDTVYQSGVWTEAGYTAYNYNANGALASRTQTSGSSSIAETFSYDNIQGVVKKYTRTAGASVDDWRYRYTASGEREQKRLYATTLQPAKEWTYYLLDGAQRQMAVYAGVETSQTSCGNNSVPSVYLTPTEYLFYGQGDVHNLTIKPLSATANVKEYKVQDMLGSTRVAIKPDGMGGGAIISQCDYEPFGQVLWQSGAPTRLGFIDKEEDKESALGDFGVRKYDDGIGRFTSIDPLWEKYRSLTPYQYGANNPLTIKDPSGKVLGVGIQNAWEEGEGNTPSRYDGVKQGDPPKGSSHLEESFKESLGDCRRAVTSSPGIAADVGRGIWEGAKSYARLLGENQKKKEAAEIAMIPDAVQLTGGASSVLGVGGSGSTGVVILLKGPDRGIHPIFTGGMGGGVDVDLSFGISFGKRLNTPESTTTLTSLEGIGMQYGISAGVFGNVGYIGSAGNDSLGGVWIFSGMSVGASPLPSPVSGSVQTTLTKTVPGISFP